MIANKYFFIQIKPLSGPIEEGTLVSIEGSNLGLKEEDVKGKIRIGHVPCELIDYQVSVIIFRPFLQSTTTMNSFLLESIFHFFLLILIGYWLLIYNDLWLAQEMGVRTESCADGSVDLCMSESVATGALYSSSLAGFPV